MRWTQGTSRGQQSGRAKKWLSQAKQVLGWSCREGEGWVYGYATHVSGASRGTGADWAAHRKGRSSNSNSPNITPYSTSPCLPLFVPRHTGWGLQQTCRRVTKFIFASQGCRCPFTARTLAAIKQPSRRPPFLMLLSPTLIESSLMAVCLWRYPQCFLGTCSFLLAGCTLRPLPPGSLPPCPHPARTLGTVTTSATSRGVTGAARCSAQPCP